MIISSLQQFIIIEMLPHCEMGASGITRRNVLNVSFNTTHTYFSKPDPLEKRKAKIETQHNRRNDCILIAVCAEQIRGRLSKNPITCIFLTFFFFFSVYTNSFQRIYFVTIFNGLVVLVRCHLIAYWNVLALCNPLCLGSSDETRLFHVSDCIMMIL